MTTLDMTDVEALVIPRITFWVSGRPAPQGSKKRGAAGQMREASPYLPAWRAAVERAAYVRYHEMELDPAMLPLFKGPVGVRVTFSVPWDPATTPDGDKLERATWDALSKARMWEDDARVVDWSGSKRHVGADGPGALIVVWAVTL